MTICRPVACLCALLLTAAAFTGCSHKHVTLDHLEQEPVLNYTAPAEGEEIVVIHVRDMGDVKIKLFPELLPEACENFTTLAQSGYYDDLIFHRVIEDFMIQGGDPKADGTGGESCWGGEFDGGWSPQLLHLPGALAYANSAGTSTDGSQFYIVTGQPMPESTLDYYTEELNIYYTQEARSLYGQYGGYASLDGGNYTVFGQVFDGLDIVYAISQVDTDANDKPRDAVYIDSVTVEQYDGSAVRFYPADYALQ
ncbi:MAG: peptidylprolyl isomerase [Oscillospiraceae bacterium]|nr:peptidylprolyl isomerase [Oscillospiraceae bacterium]